MAQNVFRESLERSIAESTHVYAAQHAYVALLFGVSGRLLVAGSRSDAGIQRELSVFPEGLVVGFSIIGDSLKVRLRVRGGRLTRVTGNPKADLDVVFKHVRHAFMVLSFQESTPQAFANQRFITQGDAALAMRFTRCLNRVQAISLPKFVAARALKALPPMTFGEKLALSAKLYAHLILLARGPARFDPSS